MKKYLNTGFTLIELLVAIAIIGILSGLVVSGTVSHKSKARDANRLSQINALKDGVELYFEENGKFPDNLEQIRSFFNGDLEDPQQRPYTYKNISASSKEYCIGTKMEILTQETPPCTTDNTEDNYTIKGP